MKLSHVKIKQLKENKCAALKLPEATILEVNV